MFRGVMPMTRPIDRASLTQPLNTYFGAALLLSYSQASLMRFISCLPNHEKSAGGLGLDAPKTTPRVPPVPRIWGPWRPPPRPDINKPGLTSIGPLKRRCGPKSNQLRSGRPLWSGATIAFCVDLPPAGAQWKIGEQRARPRPNPSGTCPVRSP